MLTSVVVVVALFGVGPLAKSLVMEGARAHGLKLEPSFVDVGWGWVRLRESTVTLEDVEGLHLKVDRATVDLHGLSPTQVQMRGVQVLMTGSAADLVIDLGTWAKQHHDAVGFPVVADEVAVVWKESVSHARWLTLEKGVIVPCPGGSKLTAPSANVLGYQVGPVGAIWASQKSEATFGFGNPDPEAALLRMDVDCKSGEAKLRLNSVKLSWLAKPLNIRLPIDGNVMIKGDAQLSLAPKSERREIEGTMNAQLDGYVPPHPKELNGIVFGETTTFATRLRLSKDRKKATLDKTRMAVGAFVLDGQGLIERKSEYASLTLSMAGNIPCSSLAKSAAVANLGDVFGGLLGDSVSNVVDGSVRVAVRVEADSRHLDEAEIKQSVRVDCGLGL